MEVYMLEDNMWLLLEVKMKKLVKLLEFLKIQYKMDLEELIKIVGILLTKIF
jgi:hypothetical protein